MAGDVRRQSRPLPGVYVTDCAFIWRQIVATARLTRDLTRFVRAPVTTAEATELVRARVANREPAFLALVRRTVYRHRNSPYRRLLDHAGCTYADLVQQVQRDGLDATLRRLAEQGVYVTQAEMKGRADIMRGSLRFRATPEQFDNPLVRPQFVVPTSGSSGRQLAVGRSLAELAEIDDVVAVALATCGMSRPAYVKWSTLPHAVMENLHLGSSVVGWFNPVGSIPLAVRALQAWVAAIVRLSGGEMAWPREHLLTAPDTLADWLRQQLGTHGPILMDATASSAVRVSAAATEGGISLAGLCWMPWGEPLTPAREQIITASGAMTLPVYSTVETGPIAVACANRTVADAMHVRGERFVVGHRSADDDAPSVPALAPADSGVAGALLVTTLGPAAPKIMLNAETGDAAEFLPGRCGCLLEDVGLTRRIANIRSVEKLTGEGVTLVGTDLVAIIEETLPRVLGGRMGDFQLLEAERGDGTVRLLLRVRPTVPDLDANRARSILLGAIAAQSPHHEHMARLLDAASTVQVEREDPWVTSSGKTPAFVPLAARRRD